MQLSAKDYKRLLEYYRQALFQYGEDDARSVHWVTQTNQLERFNVLLKVGNLNNASILDMGCGTGDLFPFLKAHVPSFDYTGIDIVPDFIDIAQKKYPDQKFFITNILDLPDQKKFDVVIASGALSFKVENNTQYYKDIIKKMYSLCKKAVAFNMLDNSSHIDDEIYAAYNPREIAEFCHSIASRIEIFTNYMPQDFTVMMYRE